MVDQASPLRTITKIIFIGGAILVFAFLAYFIITLVPKAISGLSNAGSSLTNNLKNGKEIIVNVNDSEINSGVPFVISWEYTSTKPGEYYISYSCDDSLAMDIKSSNGLKRILCNTPFNIGENINAINLIPTITKKNIFIDSTITISYKDFQTNEQIAYGDKIVTLKNISGSTTTSNPYNATVSETTVESKPLETQTNTSLFGLAMPTVPTATISPTKTTYIQGKPDLQISNIFATYDSSLSFIVRNIGPKTSGNWYFSYTDATNPSNVIQSPIQASLGSGQGLLLNVRFDGQKYDSQNINIYIDSNNSVSESNESNNFSSVTIYGNNNSYDYYDDNYYDRDEDADLVIEDLEVGRISGSRFVEDDEIDDNDTAAVRFVVRNKGGESTGDWRYEITNTPDDNDYRSSKQSSLRSGTEKTFIVEFDDIDNGIYNIKVEVDSDDDVDEERENNNTESERLEVTN